jgi:hypothetical protein
MQPGPVETPRPDKGLYGERHRVTPSHMASGARHKAQSWMNRHFALRNSSGWKVQVMVPK